jgi:hypothetical protein
MKLKVFITSLVLGICITRPVVAQTIISGKQKSSASVASRTILTNEWITGAMPDTTGSGTPTTAILKQLVIPNANLQPLGVTLGGPQLIVSNNPERFTGDGWLFQHSFTDATQGGVDYPLSGTTRVYMFHLNFTSPAATKYISLVILNPGASAVTYSYKGAHYTNTDRPLTGAATGQSYWVSRDWISNTPTTTSGTINANSKLIVFTKQVNSSNMFDGLYEVTTSGPVYYYTVVTSGSNANTVRSAASTGSAYASFAMPPDPRVTQSDYRKETGSTYARGAGVFTASELTSDNVLIVPDVPSRIGFCYNTSNKFYPMLEKQTPAIVVKTPPTTDSVRSLHSSSHNYGDYGMYFKNDFHLQNNSSTTKTINVYFAENENLVDAAVPNGRWNSRFKIDGVASAAYDTYIQGNNPRKLLKTVTVPTGTTDFSIEVYIPGLITTNHQLIFETVTTVPVTLPVTLLSFEGKEVQNGNLLTWKTEQESNLSHYVVESKSNETEYKPLAIMNAGNKATQQTYSFTDETAAMLPGKRLYRLKMVNHDGSYTLSPVINIQNKTSYHFKVAGNPFSNELQLHWTAANNKDATVRLIKTDGQVHYSGILKSNKGFNRQTLTHLYHLPAGTYLVELVLDEQRHTHSVIKMH